MLTAFNSVATITRQWRIPLLSILVVIAIYQFHFLCHLFKDVANFLSCYARGKEGAGVKITSLLVLSNVFFLE